MDTWLVNWLYACAGFAVLAVVLCIAGCAIGHTSGKNHYEKGVNRSVGFVTATFCSVCMWMMYTCAYFHQVYPMVTPDFEDPDK